MCDDIKDVKLSLTVMVYKEKNKVLYAVADNHFTDILLSFLTLPLGKMVKVLEKHEAATIGSISSLYHGLANLDSSHFVTGAAKNTLLHPMSSFEAEHESLKLDITDYQPAQYFRCINCTHRVRSLSIYYDQLRTYCPDCKTCNYKKVFEKRSGAASGGGVFTKHSTSFIISDDLQILPNGSGFSRIIAILGITDMDKAQPITVDLGLSQIMNLLKASLSSPTPLSDVILKKTLVTVNSESQPVIAKEQNPDCKFILKVMIQKCTGKLLYAEANEKFIAFLFSLLIIPLGRVEHLLAGNGKSSFMKAINNLYRSATDLIDGQYLKTPATKNRLMSLNLPHGYISENYMLPLIEEPLPAYYVDLFLSSSSDKFPNGKGSYLRVPQTYEVKDDLTVTPFCFASVHSRLREQKIQISDVKEMELQIGLREGLSILKASLTSTTALTDALLITQISNKQPKTEVI